MCAGYILAYSEASQIVHNSSHGIDNPLITIDEHTITGSHGDAGSLGVGHPGYEIRILCDTGIIYELHGNRIEVSALDHKAELVYIITCQHHVVTAMQQSIS